MRSVETTYAWFLASWAKRLSWKEVAEVFHTRWDSVVRSVKMAVTWGLEHRDLSGISAIDTDEICWRKQGEKFVTQVYQLDAGARRLLWIGRDRTAKTFRDFFDWFGSERCQMNMATNSPITNSQNPCRFLLCFFAYVPASIRLFKSHLPNLQ